MEMKPTTLREPYQPDIDSTTITDSLENNETLMMKNETENIKGEEEETIKGKLPLEKTKETKDVDNNPNPKVKVRPLSTKSTRSTDSRDKVTRRGPNHLLKGKLTVKRRNSSSEFIKKGHALPKRFLKKQEATKQCETEGGANQSNGRPGSNLSATEEETSKSRDQGNRPESSKSTLSNKSAKNGQANVESDSKSEKIKSPVQENKIKATGIKKTWQRLKSEKVKEKLPTSYRNGSLPKENKSNIVANGLSNIDTHVHENVTKQADIQTKDSVNEKSKSSLNNKGSPPAELKHVSRNSVQEGECSNETTDPTVQYSSNAKDTDEEKTKSLVSNSDSWIQSAIPYLPLGLSVICLLMNIIIPGSGIYFLSNSNDVKSRLLKINDQFKF